MRKLKKIILHCSIAFIIVFVILPILGHFLPLEFTISNHESIYDKIRYVGFTIIIFSSLLLTLKKADTKSIIIKKLVLTFGAATLSLIILFMIQQPKNCIWIDKQILFEKKSNKKTKIILRYFSCGETDAYFLTYKVVKVTDFLPYLVLVNTIDTTKLNTQEWNRIER